MAIDAIVCRRKSAPKIEEFLRVSANKALNSKNIYARDLRITKESTSWVQAMRLPVPAFNHFYNECNARQTLTKTPDLEGGPLLSTRTSPPSARSTVRVGTLEDFFEYSATRSAAVDVGPRLDDETVRKWKTKQT
jgi:hypothetical protein